MADFRSERMPSPEGHGNAKSAWQRAWDAYASTVNKAAMPVMRPVAKLWAQNTALDLMGFWLAWHLEGGFEGVQKALGLSRSGVYRRLATFRRVTGKHPDDFMLSGVKFDLEEHIRDSMEDSSSSTERSSRS